MSKGLAVVTGASTGIGLELARCCAQDSYDLVVCADEPEIESAAAGLGGSVQVTPVNADLGAEAGVDKLMAAVGGRDIELLLANAGIGLGDAFLDQEWGAARRVVEVNVIGTLALLHRAGRRMRARGTGRILITGSIAGYMPGSYHAVYNASKAFLDNFAYALGNELKDSGVTVTCLMPGVTDTAFFDRAGLTDTKLGATDKKADPADVAQAGYKAMMKGESGVVPGAANKLQAKMAGVTPQPALAETHRKLAEPGIGG
jgi:short-subunit dehydrogenase